MDGDGVLGDCGYTSSPVHSCPSEKKVWIRSGIADTVIVRPKKENINIKLFHFIPSIRSHRSHHHPIPPTSYFLPSSLPPSQCTMVAKVMHRAFSAFLSLVLNEHQEWSMHPLSSYIPITPNRQENRTEQQTTNTLSEEQWRSAMGRWVALRLRLELRLMREWEWCGGMLRLVWWERESYCNSTSFFNNSNDILNIIIH